MKTTIGVDPGQSGAIGVLVDGKFAEVYSMPLEAKKKGNQIDCAALAELAERIKHRYMRGYPPAQKEGTEVLVVVEHVSANRRQGVSSMFSFGDSFGCARFFAALIGAPTVLVHPSRWKPAMGLSLPAKKKRAQRGTKKAQNEKNKRYAEGKKFALTRAKRLFPEAREFLSRKKDEGRAESLLLARYAFDFPIS